MSLVTPSTVDFPSSDPAGRHSSHPAPTQRPPYLPFRRISLPTAPSLLHRESVVSVASFDSLPEEGPPTTGSTAFTTPSNVNANGVAGRKSKGRLMSMELRRGGVSRRNDVKPVDEAREAKRSKVIHEFYETEVTYVDGLELIYSHFLTPIIASLDSPRPLLDRTQLTAVFSNFIDIWNLHRSFFSSLSALLVHSPPSTPNTLIDNPPLLSPILLSHFPYLSLYTPFVTSFPTLISSLTSLSSPSSSRFDQAFTTFVATQESDPRCGKLKLRDWLLTIVQRCPRYLLLLKDLLDSTDPDDFEYRQLKAVFGLVSKITLSLNTSLQTHAQTLSLLALQRATPNLPFQLIIPGRTLIKRGPLHMLEQSSGKTPKREFLLFSDCMIWLASEESDREWGAWEWGASGLGSNAYGIGAKTRPGLVRTRSKSEAEISLLRARAPGSSSSLVGSDIRLSENFKSQSSESSPATARPSKPYRRSYAPSNNMKPFTPSNMITRQASSNPASPSSQNYSPSSAEERWVYKGKAELVDLEVVVSPGVKHRPKSYLSDGDDALERGPDEEEQNEGERRFEILSPGGSFAVYTATEEEREEWSTAIRLAKSQLMISLNEKHPNSTLTSSSSTNHLRRSLQALPFPPEDERLGPDGGNPTTGSKRLWGGRKAKEEKDKTMQHERRGRVDHWVPAIWVPDGKTEGCMRCGRGFGWRRRRHHCRLCGRCVCAACSGRTFFISDPTSKESSKPARACDACYETVFPLLDRPTDSGQLPGPFSSNTHTIGTLSGFPSLLTVPAMPLISTPNAEALMAIERETKRPLSRIEDVSGDGNERREGSSGGRMRIKVPSRPKSYHQILDDFESQGQEGFDVDSQAHEDEAYLRQDQDTSGLTERRGVSISSSPPRRENTARRSKRFSMPAVALQTTSVTARTSSGLEEGVGPGKSKRFSLVLGGRTGGGGSGRGIGRTRSSEMGGKHGNVANKERETEGKDKSDLARGIAAGRLSELLGRRKN